MGKLEGRIALITGGNSGIGLATAKRYVDEGAYVFINGRREVELLSAAKDIGKNVKALKGDVSNLDELDRIVAQIKEDKSKLDIVFANAGIAKYATLGEITEELYDSIFTINVKGMLFTVQKALPLMPDGAAIILTSSIVGSKGLGANSVRHSSGSRVRPSWSTALFRHRTSRSPLLVAPTDPKVSTTISNRFAFMLDGRCVSHPIEPDMRNGPFFAAAPGFVTRAGGGNITSTWGSRQKLAALRRPCGLLRRLVG
jgi:NAD(P)-dependent dehydrogenase (short-subunit alcohol dehydrogenase family)